LGLKKEIGSTPSTQSIIEKRVIMKGRKIRPYDVAKANLETPGGSRHHG
jgi:hypothetical protein